MDKGTEPPKPNGHDKRRFRSNVTPRVQVSHEVVRFEMHGNREIFKNCDLAMPLGYFVPASLF